MSDRCAYVHPPEAIRCVRTADRGQPRCTGHRDDGDGAADYQQRADPELDGRLLYLQHLRRQRDQALTEVTELREDNLRTCQLVADMHAAATGRSGEAPQHGVVEDVAQVRKQGEQARAQLAAAHAGLDRVRNLRDNLRAELSEARAELVLVGKQRDAAEEAERHARMLAAEGMSETAQLHRQLDSLGDSPDKLASLVGAGMEVRLYGRIYVPREDDVVQAPTAAQPTDGYGEPEPAGWAGAEELAHLRDGTVRVEPQLLEAERGLFVPVPAGHMLSVTVSPYDPAPDEDAVEHDGTCRHD